MKVLNDYWRVFLGLVFILAGGLVIQFNTSAETDALAEKRALEAEITALERELAKPTLTVETMGDEAEVIQQASNHARDMGAKMIETQRILSEFYRTNEPLDPNEDLTVVREAEKTYTRLTGSTNYGNTWLLRADWTMELDTVANYSSGEDVPVVFSMYTAEGKLAGLVRGVYDVSDDLLDTILIDYTVDGENDRQDVGGH